MFPFSRKGPFLKCPVEEGDNRLQIRGRLRDSPFDFIAAASSYSEISLLSQLRKWLEAIAQRWNIGLLHDQIECILTLNVHQMDGLEQTKFRSASGAFASWLYIMLLSCSSDSKWGVSSSWIIQRPQGDITYTDDEILRRVYRNPDALAFHRKLCSSSRDALFKANRMLFVTKGGYFGTGPLLMRDTDRLYRLEGFSTDVVLRSPKGWTTVKEGEEEQDICEVQLVGPALTADPSVYRRERWMTFGLDYHCEARLTMGPYETMGII
ncbi:hypothetical protein K458DRAFT_418501 [Lentithecium fluviatile CBS 122367]|uniref:Uncharacterized protein n=1 Tax=Lentithecium fluviatile CBS 122367 TaxID=1168545 RepID=A0A6G1J102_9PLEO|nr:hypothetical protein K458DRAFT_418501 [Lentithecium fluviatile CBS 122367]